MASDLGISSGISIALDFMKYKEDEELRKLQKQEAERQIAQRKILDPLEVEKAQADTKKAGTEANRSAVALESDIFSREMQSKYGEEQILNDMAYRRAVTDNYSARTEETNKRTEGLISEQTKIDLGNDAVLFADGLEMLKKQNISNFELNTVAIMFDSIKSPQLRAQIANLNPQYLGAVREMLPVLQNISQGGEIDELPPGFNESITSIMKPQTDTAYVGAEFIHKTDEQTERKGVVEGIEYDGQLIAKGRGDKMILGAKVTVNFGDTKEVFSTFLPDRDDNNKFVFRSDLPEDDAKAVSVADVMDIVSSNFPVAQALFDNPSMLRHLEKVNSVYIKNNYPLGQRNAEEDMKSARAVLGFEEANYFTTLAQAKLETFINNPDINDQSPELQQAARIFYSRYTDKSGIIVKKDGTYAPSSEHPDLLAAIFSNAPDVSALKQSYDGRTIEELNQEKRDDPDASATPTIYPIYGVNIPYDSTPQQTYDAVRQNFAKNPDLQAEIDNFHAGFMDALQNNIVEEDEYAYELSSHIKKYFSSIGD